jgi:hypothetical protein
MVCFFAFSGCRRIKTIAGRFRNDNSIGSQPSGADLLRAISGGNSFSGVTGELLGSNPPDDIQACCGLGCVRESRSHVYQHVTSSSISMLQGTLLVASLQDFRLPQ